MFDFETAELMGGGANVNDVMTMQDTVTAWLLVAVVCLWTLEFTKDWRAASLAPWLLLFDGGVGALDIFKEAGGNNVNLYSILASPQHDYHHQRRSAAVGQFHQRPVPATSRPLLLGPWPSCCGFSTLLWRLGRNALGAWCAIASAWPPGLITGLNCPGAHLHRADLPRPDTVPVCPVPRTGRAGGRVSGGERPPGCAAGDGHAWPWALRRIRIPLLCLGTGMAGRHPGRADAGADFSQI